MFGLLLTCTLCTANVAPAPEAVASSAVEVVAASSGALSFEQYQTQKRVTVLRALGATALVLGVVAGVATIILLATRDPDNRLAPVLAVGVGAFALVVSGAAMIGRAGFLARRLEREREQSRSRWPIRW